MTNLKFMDCWATAFEIDLLHYKNTPSAEAKQTAFEKAKTSAKNAFYFAAMGNHNPDQHIPNVMEFLDNWESTKA